MARISIPNYTNKNKLLKTLTRQRETGPRLEIWEGELLSTQKGNSRKSFFKGVQRG